MSDEPLEQRSAEEWVQQILGERQEALSNVARTGHSRHGRGAVFIWPTERTADKDTIRASYAPLASEAFAQAGEHPRQAAETYDPAAEFVAVFVDQEEGVVTVVAALAPPAPAPMPAGS